VKISYIRGILLSLFCVISANAFGQDLIESYLESAEQKANDVVYNAGAQGRGVAMEVGQAALNAIASFRSAYADSLKKTETALTGQQAVLFQNIKSSMYLLDEWSQGMGNNLQGVADTLSNAVLNIPLSHDIPRVSKVGPLYSVDLTGIANELVIHGIGLSNGTPFLEIAGKGPVFPNTKTDSEMRFSMPPHTPVTDKPLLFPVVLHLFERDGNYCLLGKCLSVNYRERTYPIRLAVYPKEIGKVSVIARRRVSQTLTQPKATGGFRCESPHGDGSSATPVNVTADPNWSIDVSTIQYHSNYSNHGTMTFNSKAPSGFTATLSCYGWGRNMVDAGQQGVEQGGFSYIETQDGTSLQNADPKSLVLKWGDSINVSDLPADTETVLIELIPFTGQTLDLEGTGNNRFMVLQFNAASKVATISARGIEEALRQGG
jgi:hypothetical protein